MKHLIEYLRRQNDMPYGLALHVGAGQGTDMAALRLLAPARLCLVEAHPLLAQELARKAVPGEQVLNLAVAASSAPAKLNLLNNPRESSLLPAGGLASFLPNLRQVGSVDVEGATLADLMHRLGPLADENNLLLLELAGLDNAVLDSTPDEVWFGFRHIGVRAGSVALYEGGSDHASVELRLAALGFHPCHSDPGAMEPYRVTLYQRDDHQVQTRRTYGLLLQESQRQCAAQQAECVSLSKLLAARGARLEQAEVALAAADTDLAACRTELAACDTGLALREAELTALQSELRASEERGAQLPRLETQLADGAGRIDQLESERDGLREELGQARARCGQLERDCATWTAAADQQLARATAAEAELRARQELIVTLLADQGEQRTQAQAATDEVARLRSVEHKLHTALAQARTDLGLLRQQEAAQAVQAQAATAEIERLRGQVSATGHALEQRTMEQRHEAAAAERTLQELQQLQSRHAEMVQESAAAAAISQQRADAAQQEYTESLARERREAALRLAEIEQAHADALRAAAQADARAAAIEAEAAQRLAAQERAHHEELANAQAGFAVAEAQAAQRLAAAEQALLDERADAQAARAAAQTEAAQRFAALERALLDERAGAQAARAAAEAEAAQRLAAVEQALLDERAGAQAALAAAETEAAQRLVAVEQALLDERASAQAARAAAETEAAQRLATAERTLREALEAAAAGQAEAEAASQRSAAALREEQATQLAAAHMAGEQTIQQYEARLAEMAREHQASQAAETARLQAQLNELKQELDAQTLLATQRGEEIGRQAESLRQQEARMAELDETMRSGSVRQQKLDVEIIRAEAQIGLIRDLLLREGGL